MFGWFESLKRKIIVKYVGNVVRHLLSLLAGILVAKGVLGADEAEAFVAANAEVVIGVVSYALAQGLSILKEKGKA